MAQYIVLCGNGTYGLHNDFLSSGTSKSFNLLHYHHKVLQMLYDHVLSVTKFDDFDPSSTTKRGVISPVFASRLCLRLWYSRPYILYRWICWCRTTVMLELERWKYFICERTIIICKKWLTCLKEININICSYRGKSIYITYLYLTAIVSYYYIYQCVYTEHIVYFEKIL
jgi:hypothetical protein